MKARAAVTIKIDKKNPKLCNDACMYLTGTSSCALFRKNLYTDKHTLAYVRCRQCLIAQVKPK